MASRAAQLKKIESKNCVYQKSDYYLNIGTILALRTNGPQK